MAGHGSYRAETFAVGLDHEIRRLNAQVDLFWPSENAVLQRAGLEDGMDVLDCGCGPGRLIELLNTDYDDLRVTGLEIDATLVLAAKEYLSSAGIDGYDIVQGSAENPELPPESFDFIVMRLVLEHLVDPIVALRELKKLLRPGGRIVVISNDFEFHLRCWPAVPELDDLYEAYIASRRSDGGDPCIGRRVPELLRDSGYQVTGFEIEAAHNHLIGDPAFLLAEGAGIPAQLVQSGYLEEESFQSLVGSWKAMLEHPDHTIMRPLFVAVGENSEPTEEVETTRRPGVSSGVTGGHHEYVAPATETERDIARIWADVIGLERVGVNQNFFDLGGTSLMLEHVQIRLESRFGQELPLTLLFQHATVGALAECLGDDPGVDAVGKGAEPPSQTPQMPAEEPRRVSGEAVSRRARRRRDALLRKPTTDE